MAEAEDLKSSQCGFDPHRGHNNLISTEVNVNVLVPVSINLPHMSLWHRPGLRFIRRRSATGDS